MGAPDFWDDAEAAQAINQELADLKGGVDTYNALVAKTDDLMTLWEMGMEEKDEAVEADVKAEYDALKNDLRSLELELLLSGEYDAKTRISNFMRARAAPRRRTGRRCFFGCTGAGRSGTDFPSRRWTCSPATRPASSP